MEWIVKLQRHGGQYRITLPGELIVKLGYEDVVVVRLKRLATGGILIEEYDGKKGKKRDIQEDQS